jgi:lycopene beta-cyclase
LTKRNTNGIKQYIENLGIQNNRKEKVVFHDLLSFLEQNYQARPEYRNWRVDKASTGYTFKNSDKKSSQLVAFLQAR